MNKLVLHQVPEYETFDGFIDGIRALAGPKPAVSWFTRRQERRCYTYEQFTDHIYALREALRLRGLAGKHIAIISENSYEWLVAYMAAASCGAVAVCIDAEQSDDTIRQMLSLVDVHAAFVYGTYISICQSVLPREYLFCLSEGTESDGFSTYATLVEEGRNSLNATSERVKYDLDPNQTASIVFTSGTSSLAKPVMLTHRNILKNATDAMRYVMTYERVFTHLPFYHSYGMTCGVISTLVHSGEVIINGNLRTVSRDMLLANADTIMTVPLLLETIVNQIWLTAEKSGQAARLKKAFAIVRILHKLGIHPRIAALDEIRKKAFGSIHVVIAGGAALSTTVEETLSLLDLTVLQGYGISECSPLVAVNTNTFRRFGSVGPILDSFESKIVDGEIWLKGPSVMPGYYNAPELTAEVMEDGWFKTGDIGYIDKNGFLFLTGRKKNLIVFKNGKKIAPEKMEELIGRIPLVREVVVYGAANGDSADAIKLAASIYPDPDRSQGMSSYDILASLQKSIDEINATLPLYQHILMINIQKEPFAKTGTKKIKRHMV